MNYEQGDIVLMHYPNTDLSSSKKRPALVVSNHAFNAKQDDVIACLITTNLQEDSYSVIIDSHDLAEGSLPAVSRIKAQRVFTAEKTIIEKKIGKVSNKKLDEALKRLWKAVQMNTKET